MAHMCAHTHRKVSLTFAQHNAHNLHLKNTVFKDPINFKMTGRSSAKRTEEINGQSWDVKGLAS